MTNLASMTTFTTMCNSLSRHLLKGYYCKPLTYLHLNPQKDLKTILIFLKLLRIRLVNKNPEASLVQINLNSSERCKPKLYLQKSKSGKSKAVVLPLSQVRRKNTAMLLH